MDDQTSKIVAQTIANLAEITTRNTMGAISDKIKKAKAGADKNKTIKELEEMINSLLNDKIELERISKTLENELVSQQISDDDIAFIVDSIVPLVKELTKGDAKQQEYIGYIEKLLSKESLKVMQLVGFNYREAIGGPLTNLCADAIKKLSSNSTDQNEIGVATLKNQTALAQLSADPEAFNRFARLLGREDLVSEVKKVIKSNDDSNN